MQHTMQSHREVGVWRRLWRSLFGSPIEAERWLTAQEFLREQGLDHSPGRCRGFGRTASFLARERGIEPRSKLKSRRNRKGAEISASPVRCYPESLLLAALDHQTKPKEVVQ